MGPPVRRPQRINYLILRYMRRPLMTLVTVYAVSMVGWILIPGIGVDGQPERLSFFHAFYFLTYTATTTGFGELPHAFTEAQRMWGILSLYVGVIAWFYALGSIVGLVQNPDFQLALDERRFTRWVAGIKEPFCIICGFGNTGALLTRGLTDAGMTVAVIDRRPERIKVLQIRDYRSPVAGLCADARVPEHLLEAGLTSPNCKAVIALTQDEELNLKIAVSARLLCRDVEVVAQSTSRTHEEILATLGGSVHIIDPFQTYARYLCATIRSPMIHMVNEWLAGSAGAMLDRETRPPGGRWIICGMGRMGGWLTELLQKENIEISAIDPNSGLQCDHARQVVTGRATRENLVEAGIGSVAGVVVATQSDTDNLSIVLNARALNPDAFIIVRQNRYRNMMLFEAAKADMIMMPSLVSARRILFHLKAPMLRSFFEYLGAGEADGPSAEDIVTRLRERVGGVQPQVWTIDTAALDTTTFAAARRRGMRLTLAHVLSDPADHRRPLRCVPLVIETRGEERMMPDPDMELDIGDRILMCGDDRARWLIDATLNNEYTLTYLATGENRPRSWAMRHLQRILHRNRRPDRSLPDPGQS